MIPIRDENPSHGTPHLTIGLIVVNLLVFLFQASLPAPDDEAFVWKYGYVPAKLVHTPEEFKAELPGNAPVVQATDRYGRPQYDLFGRPIVVRSRIPVEAATAIPVWISIFTCMFLHGGWMHLLGNMLYLWIFGNNIEHRLGPALFLFFYLGTGLVGNLAHTFFEGSWMPLVGASGAISGVMGAYIVLYWHVRILAVVPLGWYWFTVRLPAWMFLGIYIVVQNLYPASFGQSDGVAYWAHIGGFAAGVAMIFVFPKKPPPSPALRRVIDENDADFVL
ncbi:MAG: rhomboid family intramembrane serine protease [Planctomycetia bacterium]|nr:rhomboid family intramembrane serine protease [Planctomycetia bacterium]MCC7316706.1 rhomboid family intramembrane serine protease [Planctomycetota bacterium]OQZ00549.1 MAG: hypothetical protein B6D36_14970 [Planctomycetes bacterium UTPLA1]